MTQAEQDVVWFEGLAKTFRTGFRRRPVPVLRDVSLRVAPGEVFALLGPNGAGKTTLMKALLGLVRPGAGRGTVFGYPLGDRRARARIGYQPEQPYLYPALTVDETLDFMAGLCELGAGERRARRAAVIDLCGLAEHRRQKIRKLSRGWLQRVTLAAALLADPELLLLDEPLGGLDPEARAATKDLIRRLRADGKTVWLNSHVLPDVESLADRVALLAGGRILAHGTLDDLLREDQGRVRIDYRGARVAPPPGVEACALRPGEESWELPAVTPVQVSAALRELLRAQVQVTAVTPQREGLERFFERVLREDQNAQRARRAA